MVRTVTVTHEGAVYNVHDGSLCEGVDGFTFAFCSTCEWCGPDRVSPDRAERDLELHQQRQGEGK